MRHPHSRDVALRCIVIVCACAVCFAAVQEVLPLPGGYGWVTLNNKIRLEVSRRRLKDLMNRLGEC